MQRLLPHFLETSQPDTNTCLDRIFSKNRYSDVCVAHNMLPIQNLEKGHKILYLNLCVRNLAWSYNGVKRGIIKLRNGLQLIFELYNPHNLIRVAY